MKNFLNNQCSPGNSMTLFQLADTIKECNCVVDENDPVCQEAFFKAKQLTDSIRNIDPARMKLELLPLQGVLWKNWGQLVKEQYRNKSSE